MSTMFTTDVDVAGAAASLHCSVKTVYRMLRTGKLAGYRVGAGRGEWRVRQQAIEAVKRPVDASASPLPVRARVAPMRSGRLPGWNKFARTA